MKPNDDYRSMFDKKHLGAWDLQDRDVTVEITKCVQGELRNKQGKDRKPIVHLKGTEKTFPLCKTNADAIANMYGPKVSAWVGKRITIYPTMVPFGSQMVAAIRIRPGVPAASKKSEAVESQPVDEAMRAAQAAAADGVTSDNPDEGP